MEKNKSLQAIRSQKVTKANAIIQKTRYSLNVREQKLILYLLSMIEPGDDDFKYYEVGINEFCRVCGISEDSKSRYEAIREMVDGLKDQHFWITTPDAPQGVTVDWVSKARMSSGVIRIRLDEDLKPYLLSLRKNFTSYELIFVLRFKCKYSFRLYEFLRSFHYRELETIEKVFEIDELRKTLDAEHYKTWQHFRDHVLIPAVADINAYSDKNISCEPIKLGRAYKYVKFIIWSKDSLEALKVRSDNNKFLGLPPDETTLWDTLDSKGYIDGTGEPEISPEEQKRRGAEILKMLGVTDDE